MTIAANSRYYNVETATWEGSDGSVVRYLRRRFLPALERFSLLQTYQVVEGDRLDNVTAKFLADPEQFWRLCDANPVMMPTELEQLGTRIRITLPEGIPGNPHA
jgi:hypothetical protein